MGVDLQASGAATQVQPPARDRPRFVLKGLRGCAVVAWGSWLVSMGLLWGQHQLRILHPWAFAFLLLLALTVLAALCGLACAVWRVARGPRRHAALAWGFVALLPVAFWAALAAYILHLQASYSTPKNTLTNLASVAIASLMEIQAKSTYPHRLESERLVMFYDDGVTDPPRELEAMDRHVAQLETLTGQPLREKIYWVRGELFGQRWMAIQGLALGSSRSPADWGTADHPFRFVDRHELAHAVIHQRQPADTNAPTLLIEGWAEAQSGMTSPKRAALAKQSRARWRERTGAGPTESYLRELTGPLWYHRIDSPVYHVGGALAGFIVRQYGPEPFLRLYLACRPGRFEAECATQLGVAFDTLESEFWAEVERLAGDAGPTKRE